MKKSSFGRMTVFGVMLMLFAALPAVASADSGVKVKYEAGGELAFSGPTQVLATLAFLGDPDAIGLSLVVGPVPPTDTVSEFKYHKDGSLKEVRVTTTNELTVGLISVAACTPDDAFCSALVGSFAISLHDSEVKVKDVTLGTELYPGVFFTLSGKIKGKLESDFSLVKPGEGTMEGTAKLKIKGTATYVCVLELADVLTASFIPISACEAGMGKLIHPELDVVDSGKFKIETTSGVFSDIDKSKGKLTIAADFPGGDLTIAIEGKFERADD